MTAHRGQENLGGLYFVFASCTLSKKMRLGESVRNRARLSLATGVSLVLFAAIVHTATRPIPEVVNVRVFAHLENGGLDLLVRVPLAAVKDIQFPLRGEAGYLDLEALPSMLPGAADQWIAGGFEVFDHGEPVSRAEVDHPRISLISDQSFDAYQTALDHLVAPPVPASENLFLDQVWFDMRLRYRMASNEPAVAIDPKVAAWGVRVSTDLKIVDAAGQARTLVFDGNPGTIYLAPRWTDASRQFIDRGSRFVRSTAPLLLFLFCLVLPFRRYRPALPPVIAFVAMLLVGLLAALLGLRSDAVWFQPLLAVLEVVAILLAAFANIADQVTPRRRTLFACCAGLVFGLSSAATLETALQFGGAHRLVSALAFSTGTVVTLIAAAAFVVPVMSYFFSRARTERIERVIVSALAADTAWGWLTDRWTELAKIPFNVVFETGAAALVLRVLAGLVLLAGALWFLNDWLKSYDLGDAKAVSPTDRKSPA
jgi:xanthosine utilization system XapX-like protein